MAGLGDESVYRYQLIQRFGEGDNNGQVALLMLHYALDRSGPLHAEGGFEIAFFHTVSGIRKEKHSVSFYQIV